MLALRLSSIMAMAAVPLRTIFVEVSPKSQLGCLTCQGRYLSSFFYQSSMPPSVAPGVLSIDPDVNIMEDLPVESLLAIEEGLSVQSNSPAGVVEENEEPDASG